MDKPAVNADAGCRQNPGARDRRHVGDLFNLDLDAEFFGRLAHHLGGRLAARATRAVDLDVFHFHLLKTEC
jgi:hypothetical protein